MSDDEESPAPASASESTLNPADDPELDIRSKRFNPLKALLTEQMPNSDKNARAYDNLAQFEPIFKRVFCGQSEEPKRSTASTSKKPQLTLSDYQVLPRRFTAAQQAIPTRPKGNRHTRNILIRMSDPKLVGPLQLLQKWREQKCLVKVYTRNEKEVDGHVIGYIEAFDKHWNLIVSSAEQTIKRRKPRYCFRTVQATDNCDDDAAISECMRRLAALNIQIPTTKVVGNHGRSVDCTRTVPQLLVRGEQIVSIVTANATKSS